MASGMSMGQLYHYISSKEDVLFLIYKHLQMIWYEYLLQSGVEENQDPFRRLANAIHYTLEFMMQNRELFLLIYTETKYLDKRHLRVVLEMEDKSVVGFWRRLLREVTQEKSFGVDLDFLANLISFLMVFLPLRGWNLKHLPIDQSIDALVKFILRGLRLSKS